MKWAAVKACPVYGGDVKRFDFEPIRQHAGRALRGPVPDPRSGADPRTHLQRRRGRRRRHLVPGQDRARSDADRVDDSAGERRVQHREHARGAARGARSPRHGARRSGRRGRRLRRRREDRRGHLFDALPAARAHGARQRHGAGRQRPRGHLDRRSEPAGDALQRREDHRDPRDERPPAPVPPGRRVRPQRQRAPGRARDHDRERAPRHADPHAVDARGGLHRHHLSRDGRGAAQGRRSTPTAGRSRSRSGPPCRRTASARRRRST